MQKLILTTIITSFLASCQGYDHGHGLSALGATGAGTLAWKLTEGQSTDKRVAWTAASSLGALALGQHVRAKVIESEQKHYALGYKMALADSIKKQYEIIQNRQQEDTPSSRQRYVLYEFPGATEKAGVNFAPHTATLRVQED